MTELEAAGKLLVLVRDQEDVDTPPKMYINDSLNLPRLV